MEDFSTIIDKCLDPVYATLHEYQDIHNWIRNMALAVCHDLLKLDPTGAECAQVFASNGFKCFDANFKAVEGQIKTMDPDYGLACSQGCSFCCSSHITAMPHEVLFIAEALKSILTKKELKAFWGEIKKLTAGYAEKGFRNFALEYFSPCPFLKEGSCVIYDIRPLTCRNWVSQDLDACKVSFESSNKIPVPQNMVLLYQKDIVFAGHNAALSKYGIKGNRCSLLPTLEMALKDYEGSYTKWFSGELLYGQMAD